MIKLFKGKMLPYILDAFSVRYSVFIDEQKFDAEIEIDEFDENAIHAVFYQKDQAIGAARMIFLDAKKAKIGRISVNKLFRNQQIGKKLVFALLDNAKNQKKEKVVLSSQLHAVPFYEKLGFCKIGDVYLEEGQEHIFMEKIL